MYGVQWSGEECAHIGLPGAKLAHDRAGAVTVARQRGFEIVDRAQQHLLDELGRDRLGGKLEALLEGEG
ncbi:hypothetical protein [Allopontixanthobacter sediminis]|uniref:Uncharacterized protein n=1 Tax=Allopontixanthobacter sediminis TaxID=1689985 RepID=A0A845B5X7_9SPHN|nr:hypothetical protein [Allopontixanthobacter sediminis]MXP44847.1 hypothetical protein [Allopontixanthobacter sediminis]